jgi:MFS family permease
MAFGYVLGPLFARVFVAFAPLRLAFPLAGAIAFAAAVFVMARLGRGTTGEGATHADTTDHAASDEGGARVFWKIKTSCFATFAYGYFQASVVLFLPLFLIQEKGIQKEHTILIPAFFAAGMLLFSNVAGRLGDRLGHLAVMRVLGVIGLTMILGFVALDAFFPMCIAVFIAGASLASISPVSLALQGVVSAPSEVSRATAIYNAFYAAGMLIGPPISSVLFAKSGGAAMLFHLAAIWLAFVAFTIVFRSDDPAAERRLVAST